MWDHLHLRGENQMVNGPTSLKPGSPPLTWRKLILVWYVFSAFGITSTYVEKTVKESHYTSIFEFDNYSF